MKKIGRVIGKVFDILSIAVWVAVIGGVIYIVGAAIYYYHETKPVYECSVVKEVGGCGYTDCRVEMADGTFRTTNKLVAKGEKYCWDSGKRELK